MTHREYWFWLCGIPGVGAAAIKKLLEEYKAPEELFALPEEMVSEISFLSDSQKKAFLHFREEERVRKEFDRMTSLGIYFTTIEEETYPARLRQIYDPPAGLFYKGKLPADDVPAAAIVGARNCSPYGREVTLAFAEALARSGISVISGLARGVDGFAHQGALRGNGATFGILGCGVDICYPRQHLELYLQMQEKGGVLSEQLPGNAPVPRNFPMRNRLIAALSDVILVVEAREKSGSLITVDSGLELGREIFAVPGRINDSLSGGCNLLIKNGAVPALSPADVLQHFSDLEQISMPEEPVKLILDSTEKIVYACLDLVPKNIQFIVNHVQMDPPAVMECLDGLVLKGLIQEISRGYYIRTGL